jgi:hypothetical protein
VLLGFFILIGGCVGACTYFAAKKARAYAASAEKNPQFAAISLIATMHPDIQIVSKDETAGIITLRNKKTGEVVKLDMNQYSTENVGRIVEQFSKGLKIPAAGVGSSSSDADEHAENSTETADTGDTAGAGENAGNGASISPARISAMTGALKNFPAFAPAYPGSTPTEAALTSLASYTAGAYEFDTTDTAEKVADFYAAKITAAGFEIAGRNNETNEHGASVDLVATRAKPEGTFSLNAEAREGRVHVTVNFVQQ